MGPVAQLHMVDERTWRRLHNRTALDITRDEAMLRETLLWLQLTPSHPEYHRGGLTAECLWIPGPVGLAAANC